MTKYNDYYTIYDRVMETMYINRKIGEYAKKIIDDDIDGQCIFHLALMLDDIETMMNRYAVDGNEKKASRTINYPAVEGIMSEYLDYLEKHYRELDSKQDNTK